MAALRAQETAGERRAWVVLPPGAGKTLVGLVTAADLAEAGESATSSSRPNTAIQGQWVGQATEYGLVARDHRDLDLP